jgi:phosphate/sulfate permease
MRRSTPFEGGVAGIMGSDGTAKSGVSKVIVLTVGLMKVGPETRERLLSSAAVRKPSSYQSNPSPVGQIYLRALPSPESLGRRPSRWGCTRFIPTWVKISVALGLGTMVGRKRMVVTVGQKIGKTHLTYVMGASVEFIAASTIPLAEFYGMPVSTTHTAVQRHRKHYGLQRRRAAVQHRAQDFARKHRELIREP